MSISLMAQKEICLKKRYKLEEVYGIYEIITYCELCEKKMPMTKCNVQKRFVGLMGVWYMIPLDKPLIQLAIDRY